MERRRFTPEKQVRTVKINEDDWQEIVRLIASVKIDETEPPFERDVGREVLVRRAREAFLNRRARVALFGNWMFSEPAWDILLVLYMEHDLQRQTITRLTEATGAALATVVRWVRSLEQRDLVRRTEHPTDGRTEFIMLTEKALKALDSYFLRQLRL